MKIVKEERRLGTTAGGSTYMITLPKAWVEALGLKKGEALTLVKMGSVISLWRPRARDLRSQRTRLSMGEALQGKALERGLIALYIAGFDIIEVVGPLSDEQRQIIKETAQRLIGEILQETDDFVLIQTLRDPQVLSVPQLLEYIYDNAREMLREAFEALLAQDAGRAERVIQRDERVDRFFLRLSRQLYAALQDPLGEVEQGISRVEFFNVHTVARQLERIADHAVKIARTAEALVAEGRRLPRKLAESLTELQNNVQELLARVMAAFSTLSGEEVHQALEALPEIERQIEAIDRTLLGLGDPHLAYHLGIVVDSLGRVKDYAANIAEVALNAEALQLEA
jgi:phosphate uptake regulator